jgi:hypothetical protein
VSDTPRQPDEPGNAAPALERSGRNRWQFGLRTVFLLMAAIAVWMAYVINRREIATLEARIKAMQPLAHELIVDDPTKIAAVKLAEYWYDENRWDVYLPGGRYRLCLATRGVDDNGLAPVVKSRAITAGRHRLALEQQKENDAWRVAVTLDGAVALAAAEPKEWDPGTGSSGGGQYSLSEQFRVDQPTVLFRRRFMRKDATGLMTTPPGPTEGILLWIEPVTGPDPKP